MGGVECVQPLAAGAERLFRQPVQGRGHGVDIGVHVLGLGVHIDQPGDQFAGGGAYLFGSVLDRFLGLYTSLNSFNVLRIRTRQRRENLNEWAPRAGWKALI